MGYGQSKSKKSLFSKQLLDDKFFVSLVVIFTAKNAKEHEGLAGALHRAVIDAIVAFLPVATPLRFSR